MADFDEDADRLTLKLVYYGPALSGKTTNLISLHDLIRPELLGDMMVMETKNDRTLFFDLFPLGFKTRSGLLIKLKLYTVPGQVQHDSTRKAVLSRADGVVFVADSQRSQCINNGESFQNLADNCGRVGLDFNSLPVVVQYNKRDLNDILTEEEILSRWGKAPWPVTFSVAPAGEGVKETFRELLSLVYLALDNKFALADRKRVTREEFMAAALGDDEEKSVDAE